MILKGGLSAWSTPAGWGRCAAQREPQWKPCRRVMARIRPTSWPPSVPLSAQTITRSAQVRETFGAQADALLPTYGKRIHFDLWQANRLLLTQAGVRQVEIAGICTA